MAADMQDSLIEAWAAAAEANMAEAWRSFCEGPQADLSDGPDMLRGMTGIPHPALNGVLQARFQMDEIDTKIDVALAPFTARRMPMLWWIGPVTRPAGLGARLEAHGLTHAEDVPGMALDLVSFNSDLPTPPDLEIQQVADEGTLMEWSRVVATCFDVPPEHIGQVCDLFAAAGYGEQASLHHYLGIWRDEVVATSSLFLGSESAGIYCVATLPSARRKGIGTAVTAAALQDARALGYRIAILQASAMGHNVYRQLGFRDCCTYSLYYWPGSPDEEGGGTTS